MLYIFFFILKKKKIYNVFVYLAMKWNMNKVKNLFSANKYIVWLHFHLIMFNDIISAATGAFQQASPSQKGNPYQKVCTQYQAFVGLNLNQI